MLGPRLEPPQLRSWVGGIQGGLPSLLFIHSPTHPGLRPPPRRRSEKYTEAPQQRQRDRGWEGKGEMGKEKKPESLSNSRDKRTVGQQTKRPAEVTREGPARPL